MKRRPGVRGETSRLEGQSYKPCHSPSDGIHPIKNIWTFILLYPGTFYAGKRTSPGLLNSELYRYELVDSPMRTILVHDILMVSLQLSFFFFNAINVPLLGHRLSLSLTLNNYIPK